MLRSIEHIVGYPVIRSRPDGLALLQQFCSTAFAAIGCRGKTPTALYPRAQYRELFAVALHSRGEICGREESNLHLVSETWT